MFTGIVEDLGELLQIRRSGSGAEVHIRTALPGETLTPGSSVAVDGICLTVSRLGPDGFFADASHETLRTTTLGGKSGGSRLHLERALCWGGRLGGHLVTGHVDGVGEVLSRVARDSALELRIQAPPPVATFLVSKGSVAVDGVSLTINDPDGARFGVTLIPHTLAQTHLKDCRPGTRLNLEADILGKYVRHFLPGAAGQRLDKEFLARHGFLPGSEPGRR